MDSGIVIAREQPTLLVNTQVCQAARVGKILMKHVNVLK
jgi:hypothetical protein